MSPRRNRPRGGAVSQAAESARYEGGGVRYGLEQTESWQGEDWSVRMVGGSAAAKRYRCPGCDQEIPPGVPHLVVWPQYGAGVEDRRHWHKSCWNARDRRSARLQRSRNAPRY
ncbi:ATP/GTP-binding protein [Streptomyces sp. URMC 126]|uniref:ATP/GTP-binding protein n=1 Tax=Streptomyces sp. URMC 126 TaxID=3423401 RepID=UPI003F1D0770